MSGEAAQGLPGAIELGEIIQKFVKPRANPSANNPRPTDKPNQVGLLALDVSYTPILALMREPDSRLPCWEQVTTESSSLFGLWNN